MAGTHACSVPVDLSFGIDLREILALHCEFPFPTMHRMTITLNGESVSLDANATLADAIAKVAPKSNAYAIEVNRLLIPRREHALHALAQGDEVEIVVLVGGG